MMQLLCEIRVLNVPWHRICYRIVIMCERKLVIQVVIRTAGLLKLCVQSSFVALCEGVLTFAWT